MRAVTVNGRPYALDDGARMAITWLRETLGFKGPKPGCGEGVCGACTVLIDGEPALACQTPVSELAGRVVTTIEGLANGAKLHPAQQALIELHAAQCGYCMPAMALRIAVLIDHDSDPDDRAITTALEPNLCRCGSYLRIRRAAHRAADLRWRAVDPDRQATEDNFEVVDWAGDATELLPRPRRPWDLVAPEERDYEAVLGPGLVAVWPASKPSGRRAPQGGGAWVHVSPTGSVHAFSGKVDLGQDNRTAFRLLVAEELGVEPERVTVVQGDTDVCPWDIGTFGSRSLPDSGEALRRAAAGARSALDEAGGPGQFGDGCRLVVLDAEPPLVAPNERCLVGHRGHEARRADAATGHCRFVSDLERPGMGHGAVLRPSVPGASLRSVDWSRAEAIDGVTVVEVGPLVGVVADDPVTARRAISVIDTEWDEPPPINEDLAAYLRSNPIPGDGWERQVDETMGDVDGALADAAEIVRVTYTTAPLAHVPLETRAAIAEWDGGRVTVWTGDQVPFATRSEVAKAAGIDEADVRIVVPPTGGAFGGKHAGDVASEAALLARATGRPVKVHWSRSEELRWGTVRPMALIDVVAGLGQDGELVTWDFLNINAGAQALALPYRTRTSRLRYQPARSPLRQGPYRALAANANNFARESVIDELAVLSGEDPLEFRLARLNDARLAEVLRAAVERFGWAHGNVPHQIAGGRGQGLAVGLEKGGRVATCAEAQVESDGRVAIARIVTAYECGTVVNPDTVVSQIEGATMMALGGALFEAVPLTGGATPEPSLAQYRLPRFSDLPEIEVVLCDRPELPASGAGETPMIAVAPAVANALFAATGRRLRNLPLVPKHLVAGAIR